MSPEEIARRALSLEPDNEPPSEWQFVYWQNCLSKDREIHDLEFKGTDIQVMALRLYTRQDFLKKLIREVIDECVRIADEVAPAASSEETQALIVSGLRDFAK